MVQITPLPIHYSILYIYREKGYWKFVLSSLCTSTVTAFDVLPHGLSCNVTTRFWVFCSACHVLKDLTFFWHLTLKTVFLRFTRTSWDVCLKSICYCKGSHNDSNGTPLDPPLFWLDTIFKSRRMQLLFEWAFWRSLNIYITKCVVPMF